MTTFFSSTDQSELQDNTPFHNYYLSLIVNYAGEYTARVAYIANRTTTVNYKNVHDQLITSTSEKEVLAMINMTIEWETPEVVVPDYFRDRFQKLKQEKEKKVSSYVGFYQPGRVYTGPNTHQVQDDLPWNSQGWGDEYEVYDTPVVSRQGTLPFVKDGKLQIGDKQLRSLSEVKSEIKSKIHKWLMNGVEEFTYAKLTDTSIPSLLNYLKGHFDLPDNEGDYPFFVNQMQRNMPAAFHGYLPALVSATGAGVLDVDTYDDNEVCVDLFSMFDSYEQYMSTMQDIESTGKEAPKVSEVVKKETERRSLFKINKRVKK